MNYDVMNDPAFERYCAKIPDIWDQGDEMLNKNDDGTPITYYNQDGSVTFWDGNQWKTLMPVDIDERWLGALADDDKERIVVAGEIARTART